MVIYLARSPFLTVDYILRKPHVAFHFTRITISATLPDLQNFKYTWELEINLHFQGDKSGLVVCPVKQMCPYFRKPTI